MEGVTLIEGQTLKHWELRFNNMEQLLFAEAITVAHLRAFLQATAELAHSTLVVCLSKD